MIVLLAALPIVAALKLWPCGMVTPKPIAPRASSPVLGLFDNLFKESEEDKRTKEAQLAAMKEMQERRRDPIASTVDVNKRRNLELATRAASVGNLPDGWDSKVDEASGDRYFWNKQSMDVSWEPPEEMIDEMVAILEEIQKQEMEAVIADAS